MNNTFAASAVLTLCFGLFGSGNATAQQESAVRPAVSGQQVGIAEPAVEQVIMKKVGFRMANWR
jgi:hypothetical protein